MQRVETSPDKGHRLVEESSEMAEVAAEGPLLPSTNQAQSPKPKGSEGFTMPKSSTSFWRGYTRVWLPAPVGLPDLY